MTNAAIFWWLAAAFSAGAVLCATIDVAPQLQTRLDYALLAALATAVASALLALATGRSVFLRQPWVARSVAWTAALATLFALVSSSAFVP